MSSAKKQSFFGRGCFSRKLFGLLRYSATIPERIWKVKTPLYDICVKPQISFQRSSAERKGRFRIKPFLPRMIPGLV